MALSAFFAGYVQAATPTVTSFVVTPKNAGSGQLISLSWSGNNTTGFNLYYPCVPGVKVKNQDGTIFSCDTKNPTSAQSSDSFGLYVINTSGLQKTLTFKLYPKALDGTENIAGEQDQSLVLATSPFPINNFSASASTTATGVPVNFTWSGLDVDGVNIMVVCPTDISLASADGTQNIPCNQIAFTNKLSASGSVGILFRNANNDVLPVTVRVLPYISDNSYDLIHAQSLDLTIASDKTLPSQILGFSSSRPSVPSDDNVTLSWTTKYTVGVNLKMNCVDGVSLSLVTSTSTLPVPCNAFFPGTISSSALSSNASTTISLSNLSTQTKTVTFSLMTQFATGGFDGVNFQKISLSISPKGQAILVSAPIVNSLSSTIATSSPISITTPTFNSVLTGSGNTTSSSLSGFSPRKKFTKFLKTGSRGDDVLALQEFLVHNTSLSQGVSVSGYFGKLTAKAVGKFQIKYNIAQSGQAGFGTLGPATRAKLNSL